MRWVMIALSFLAAAGAHACSGEYNPSGLQFFLRNIAIIHARWNGNDTITIESVVSGDVKPGATIPLKPHFCDDLHEGQLYFIVLYCERGVCDHRAVSETHAPALLNYYSHAHYETHEYVRTKAIAWAEGNVSSASLRDWLATVAPKQTRDGEYLVPLLILRFEELATRYERLAHKERVAAEMVAVANAAKRVPYGTLSEQSLIQPEEDDPRVLNFEDRVETLEEAISNLEVAIEAANTLGPGG